jgi:hypothetical protein
MGGLRPLEQVWATITEIKCRYLRALQAPPETQITATDRPAPILLRFLKFVHFRIPRTSYAQCPVPRMLGIMFWVGRLPEIG